MNLANPINLLIAGSYFIAVGILCFFSFFGIYVFIRYGKSTYLTLITSLIFGVFFLKILSETYLSLNSLLV